MNPFHERLIEEFRSTGSEQILPKGQILLREGEIEKNLYFIESGAVRVFLLTEFDEHTIRFGYKSTIINSLGSYLNQQPSRFYIETIRKTNLRMLPKMKIDELIFSDPKLLQGYTTMIESVVSQQLEREIDLLTALPVTRFNRVMERSPMLFQEIPLKYIASYLRMTPETLSRIRKS